MFVIPVSTVGKILLNLFLALFNAPNYTQSSIILLFVTLPTYELYVFQLLIESYLPCLSTG